MTPLDPQTVITRAEFAAGLTAVRQRADLSIRELARRTKLPSGTLGGYFSGRNLPQPGQVSSLRKVLDECGVPLAEIDAWLDATERLRATPVPRPASPYPGLTSFGVDDSAVFFGRDTETALVLERLDRLRRDPGPSHGILAVVGASGSGKTSLLRAGVAAYLATLQQCRYAVRTPGTEPLAMLAQARDELGDGPAVLVIDQFEELFTATSDAEVRTRFLDELTTLAPQILVVVGMRADFYAAASHEAVLVPVLQHAQLLLGALGASGLYEAVTRPAATVEMTVEDGLIDLVLTDVAPRDSPGEAHDAGALPLLSHALRAAWERGDGRVLTMADYRAAGGIEGAVARTAEEAYDAVGPGRRDDARALFLRLVNIEDFALTRRRVAGAELVALRDAGFDEVIDAFVTRRLLTAGTGTIEISHEAVLSAWPRLRDWIDEDRIGLKLHRQVTDAANAWEHAGRDDALLLRGARLDTAADLAERPTLRTDLTRLERDFVATGIDARDAARERARRGTRRLRRLLAAVVVLFVVAAGLAGFAFVARSTAANAERDASDARDDALSRQVALRSRELRTTNPALSQQLALASFRIAPTAEARSVVIEASARPVVTRFLGVAGRTPMARSADLTAAGQADGRVRLLRLTGSRPRVVSTLRTGGAVGAAAFAPNGTTLFVLGTAGRLEIWDVSRPTEPVRRSSTALGGGIVPAAASLNRAGDELVVGGAGSAPLQRWRVSDPRRPTRLAVPAGLPAGIEVYSVARSGDDRYLAVGGDRGHVYVWDASHPGAAPLRRKTGANRQLALLFAGARLYVGDSEGVTTAMDAATGRTLGTARAKDSGWAQTLTLSPDGTTLGVGYDDSTFRQFAVTATASATPSAFPLLHEQRTPKEVVAASYLADGSGFVMTCIDGATYVVPLLGNRIPTPATTWNMSFDRAGTRVVAITSGAGGGLQVWNVDGDRPAPVTPFVRMTGTPDPATGGGTISRDGNLVAMNNFTGQVQLFDISNPARPRPWNTPFRAASKLVESLSMSPRSATLALGSDDGSVSLWDVSRPATPVELSRVRGTSAFYDVAWSPDATTIAAAGGDSSVYLWSVADPHHPVLRAKLQIPSGSGSGVAFSRDGALLATTGASGRTQLWDVSGTGPPTRHGTPLVGPEDFANGASFNADGSLLAVSSTDSTVRLYDVRSQQRSPVATLEDVGGPTFAAVFSPDGRRLLASGRSDTAPVWTVDPVVATRELCAREGSVITRAEWAQYVPGARYDPPCAGGR